MYLENNFIIHNFFFSIIFYVFLLIFVIERSLFAFIVPNKSTLLINSWITILPFFSYIILFFISVIEFSFSKGNFIVNILFGLILVCFGLCIRYKTFAVFKKYAIPWSSHILPNSIKQVINTGPYKYVRHPYYLSVLLELIGVCIFLGSFMSFFLVLLIQAPLILKRVKLEEAALKEKFSNEYVVYSKNVGKFLPKWVML